MGFTRSWRFFTDPDQEWHKVRAEQPVTLKQVLMYVLLMASIPALCLYLGTTAVGWTLPGSDNVTYLTKPSAALIAAVTYLAVPVIMVTLAGFIHWMSRTYGVEPEFVRSLTFTAYLATPMVAASVTGLIPSLWLITLASLLAIGWSVWLLFTGLPIYMDIPQERGMVFACSVLSVALVTLVTLMAASVILWNIGVGPIYIR